MEPGVPKRVQRGGSFLCSDLYCTRYLPGARGKGAVDSGASHVGFRCVHDRADHALNHTTRLGSSCSTPTSHPLLAAPLRVLTVLGFLLALLLLAHLLRSKRPPSSTIAWLLIIVLMPYVGVPLYMMFGGRKMRRMAGRKRKVYDPGDATREGVYGAGAERILRSFGVPPATVGNRVHLVTRGEEAYRELLRSHRQSRADDLHHNLHPGPRPGRRGRRQRLARRAEEGLEVRVLLDAVGSWRASRRFLAPLVEAGGQLAYFMPVVHLPFRGRTNLRNHRKIVVADGRVALTGGMNIAQEYMGPTPDSERWQDVSRSRRGTRRPRPRRRVLVGLVVRHRRGRPGRTRGPPDPSSTTGVRPCRSSRAVPTSRATRSTSRSWLFCSPRASGSGS